MMIGYLYMYKYNPTIVGKRAISDMQSLNTSFFI